MSDTRDLLREAIGSYEPLGDEWAVVRRVERRNRRRKVASGAVALGLFAGLGWLGWSALGPMVTPGSGGGTFVLSGFSVEPEADPLTAEVAFTARWSSPEYPGAHRCEVRIESADGAQIGARTLEISSLSRSSSVTTSVQVSEPPDGAAATGSCVAGRLDLAVAATIAAEHLGFDDGHLAVGYAVEVLEDERIGAQACTSAVWDAGGGLLGTTRFTLRPTEGTHYTGLGVDEPTARTEGSAATVICEPFVRPGSFPDPEPAPSRVPVVVVPAVVGLPPDQASELLQALGLRVSLAAGASGEVVVSQDPPSGASIEVGSTVTIEAGERPSPEVAVGSP